MKPHKLYIATVAPRNIHTLRKQINKLIDGFVFQVGAGWNRTQKYIKTHSANCYLLLVVSSLQKFYVWNEAATKKMSRIRNYAVLNCSKGSAVSILSLITRSHLGSIGANLPIYLIGVSTLLKK